jgi:hypothetical protein
LARSLNSQPADLKKNRSYIIGAWLLLVFFAGGQAILFAHHHKLNQSGGKTGYQSHAPLQTVTEKCQLCDALHFNTMVANEHVAVIHLLTATYCDYKALTCTFISLSRIFSPGRAPPAF